jgi:8-oxo-dGTP pyrophosphatase MutT (NUDIX family)
MPISEYLRALRSKVGHDLLVLPSAAIVIKDELGRVLFGLHSDKQIWVVPGGLVEPGELPADAAVRETYEETGLEVEVTGLLGVFGGPDLVIHYPNGDVASYVGTIFRGRVIGGELKPDGVEILDVKYMFKAEIESIGHSKWMDVAMGAMFSDSSEPKFQPATWRNQI